MTSVQKLSIPVVLGGQDVLIQSQTGSGKFGDDFVLCLLLLPSRPNKAGLKCPSVYPSVCPSTKSFLISVKFGM